MSATKWAREYRLTASYYEFKCKMGNDVTCYRCAHNQYKYTEYHVTVITCIITWGAIKKQDVFVQHQYPWQGSSGVTGHRWSTLLMSSPCKWPKGIYKPNKPVPCKDQQSQGRLNCKYIYRLCTFCLHSFILPFYPDVWGLENLKV